MEVSREPGQVLYDREDELAKLHASIAAASDGHGSLTVIEGPAGIGKTSLVGAARAAATDRGLRALTGRGSERERELAFGVVRQIFEPELRRADPSHAAALLAGAAELAGPALDATSSTGPADAFAVLHGLYWLTANLAETNPLLIAIDDAQWCDGPSLRFVDYLQNRLDDLPICLVVALRPPEPGTATTFAVDPRALHLRPRPLQEASVVALAEAQLGTVPGEVSRELHAVTGGNPFYVTALLTADHRGDARSRVQRAPESVQQAVLIRLGQIGEASTALAEAFAVLGPAPLRHAAELAGIDTPSAELLVDRLLGAAILAPGRPVDFAHPIVRSAVYGAIPSGRRSAEHRRAARLLAEEGADAIAVAAHLLAVEPAGDPWAVAQLTRAAGEAAQRGAPDTAALHLRRALAEPPAATDRLSLMLELSAALLRLGSPGEAAAPAREALELAEDPAEIAAAAVALRESLTYAGQPQEVLPALQPVVARLATRDECRAAEVELAMIASSLLHVETAAAVVDRVRELGQDLRAGALDHPHALALVSMALMFHAEVPAAELADPIREAAERWGTLTPPDQRRFFNNLLPTLVIMGHAPIAREMVDRAILSAQGLGSSTQFAAWRAWAAWSAYEQGDLLEAEADAASALDAGARTRPNFFTPLAYAFLILPQLDRGQVQLASATAREAPAQPPHSIFAAYLRWAQLRCRAAEGGEQSAVTGLLELGDVLEAAWQRSPSLIPWRTDAALLLLRLGDAERARDVAARELEVARRFGAPGALGRALRVAGLAAGGDEGLGMLEESVAVLSSSAARLEHARSLVEWGSALRRNRARREARAPLLTGWDLARSLGALPLAERAKEELLAAGARPRRDALRGRDALTASELRIARMAADGKTNPQIAQALFVTRRTVETHLGAAYRKLGIASRAELAHALVAENIVEAPR